MLFGEGQQEADASDDWPSSTVKLVCTSKAGGTSDYLARVAAEYLSEELGTNVVVTNISGGGNSVGIREAKDAKADGNTILFTHNSLLINEVVDMVDYAHDAFEIGPMIFKANALGVFTGGNSSYNEMEDLINAAKDRPGDISYAVSFGALSHISALAMADTLDVEFNFVDAGDEASKMTALLGGHIDVVPGLYGKYEGQVKSGDMKCLGLFSTNELLSVPSFQDQGFDFAFDGYPYGFFFPVGTDPAVIAKVDRAVKKMAGDPVLVEKVGGQYISVRYYSPEEARTYWDDLHNQLNTYKNIILASKK